MAKLYKPSVEEILELHKKTEELYAPVFEEFKKDDMYYELEFKALLKLPDEFQSEAVLLPTARDMVDACVDNTDIANARVYVNRKGTSEASEEEQEMLRKFFLGLIHRTNVENSLSPWRAMAKHYWLYGLAVAKTVWDADRRPNKPEQKRGESDEDYAARIDEWRSQSGEALPVVIQAVHPANIMIDPYNDVPQYVFETREKTFLDCKTRYSGWSNPKERGINDRVKCISFWTPNYRCELLDGEPVLRTGVAEHHYGFIPYVAIDTGLGNLAADGDLKKRYVGVLRYIQDILISESRDYSIADIILAKEAWPWGTIEGKGAMAVTEIDQKFGMYTPLPDDVKLVTQSPKLPPDALNQHLALSANYIASHAAPPSTRGLGEIGVRSGTDRNQLISQAAMRYRYSNQAFRNGTAKILSNCARLVKNVIPGDIRVWARTPMDEFDVKIDRNKLKPPFTCYVEFSTQSEEAEYRKHDDLERLVQSGIAPPSWARKQMSNMDPKEIEVEIELQKLINNPQVQQVTAQLAGAQMTAALAKLGLVQQIQNPSPPAPPQRASGRPAMSPTSQQPLRGLPQIPVPGSAEAIQNQLANLRSPVPINPRQGAGGGGNR